VYFNLFRDKIQIIYLIYDISRNLLKEAKPEKDWPDHAKLAIARADVFMIMLGSKTKNASGVLKELNVAIEKDT
jgi:hypothetical protein